jgi:hypothetical protein
MSSNINFNTENEMINEARHILSGMGITSFLGVPCFSRCIDLVLSIDNKLIAIEFKLHDWRRGMIQAEHHLVAVDFSYVCLPAKSVTEKMQTVFEKSDVGLMMFKVNDKSPFRIIFPAKPSKKKWDIGERWLRKALEIGVAR